MAGGPIANIPLVPMFLLTIAGITFTALVNASDLVQPDSATASGVDGTNATFAGGDEACDGVFDCIGTVLGYIFDAFTFNIEGAPAWVRFIFTGFYAFTFGLGILVIIGVLS